VPLATASVDAAIHYPSFRPLVAGESMFSNLPHNRTSSNVQTFCNGMKAIAVAQTVFDFGTVGK
jgi:hypothetical protein